MASKIDLGANAAGMISLAEFYAFLKDPDVIDEALWGKPKKGKNWKNYRRLCDSITESIPETAGFYLWGYYGKNRSWHNIYLGKSHKAVKYHLRARICEELKDERRLFERIHYTEKELLEDYRKRRKTYGGTKLLMITRDLAKANCSHIIWVSLPEVPPEHVLGIEADLIEAMNPCANRMRPKPDPARQDESEAIYRSFRSQINRNRATGYYRRNIA